MASSTDEKAIRAAKRESKRNELTNITIVKQLMSQREGRRYIWLQLAAANVFSSTICWGDDGYARTAFLEGQRAQGLALFSTVVANCSADYLLMTNENAKAKIEEPNDRYDPDSPSADTGSDVDAADD